MTTSPTSPTHSRECEPFYFGAKYYDAIHAAKDYKREAHAVASHLKLGRSSRIVEFGCGTGQFLRHFAKWDRTLVGVDISLPMIHFARLKFEELGIHAKFIPADFFTATHILASYPPYDAAFSMFGVMSYASVRESIVDLLRCVRYRLSPGSRFVFDVVNYACCAAHLRKHAMTTYATPDGPLHRHIEKTFDVQSSVLSNKITYEVAGQTCVENHEMRAFTPSEIRDAAERADFKVIGTYPGFDSPVSDDHGSAFIQASDFYFVTVLES